jgi:ABC-type nickel/cobalt efflux system permease component RcnA
MSQDEKAIAKREKRFWSHSELDRPPRTHEHALIGILQNAHRPFGMADISTAFWAEPDFLSFQSKVSSTLISGSLKTDLMRKPHKGMIQYDHLNFTSGGLWTSSRRTFCVPEDRRKPPKANAPHVPNVYVITKQGKKLNTEKPSKISIDEDFPTLTLHWSCNTNRIAQICLAPLHISLNLSTQISPSDWNLAKRKAHRHRHQHQYQYQHRHRHQHRHTRLHRRSDYVNVSSLPKR